MILGQDIISVPLPFLAAALCAVIAPLMLRLDLGRRAAAWCFAGLFACFVMQSALVGLRFGYGVERFVTVQRVLPLTVGPLLYLGFVALSLPAEIWRRRLVVHLGGAVIVASVLAAFANIYRDFDLVISASYLGYAVALFLLWRKGQDQLIHARLDAAALIRRWILMAVALLCALLLIDTLIALSFMLSQGTHAPALITFGSAALIGVLILILTKLPSQHLKLDAASPPTPGKTETAESDLETQARDVLERTQLFLDPDLTVQRLARRLSVPERALSSAINQTQGMNVSHYVNGFRLRHAAGLLRQTDDPVSKVMTQSGFLTRSNFYREFQRVYGMSPAQYRSAGSKT